MKQTFWIYNPLILIDKNYAKEIFPLNEMTEMLPYILPAKQPMILLGMTGAGKTQYCKTVVREAYAKTLGLMADEIGFVTEQLSSRDACELAGVALPMKDADGNINTKFTKPPLIAAIEATGLDHGIIFLDEAAQAAVMVSSAKSERAPARRALDCILVCLELGLGNPTDHCCVSMNTPARRQCRRPAIAGGARHPREQFRAERDVGGQVRWRARRWARWRGRWGWS